MPKTPKKPRKVVPVKKPKKVENKEVTKPVE